MDPDSLELDLIVVSFVGRGRGGGFLKTDEHSILNDGDWSPKIARRVADLCRMFLEAGELEEEGLIEMLGLGSTKEENRSRELIERLLIELENERLTHKKEVESPRHSRERCELLEGRLRDAEIKLNEKSEEDEMRDRVDFILRSGLDLQKTRIIDFGDQGWFISISKETTPYIRYLWKVIPHLPHRLKTSLLERVQAEDSEGRRYLRLFSSLPRIKTISEMALDPEHRVVDDGTGVTAYPALGQSITTQSLIAIVNEARKSII